MSKFRFTKGPKILVDALNKVLDDSDSNELKPSSTISVTKSQGGTLANVIANGNNSGDFPYKGSDASSGSTAGIKVQYGTHNGFPPTIDGNPLIPVPPNPRPILTLDSGAQIVYVQFDFTYDLGGTVTITDGSIQSSDSPTPPISTTIPSGAGGSGTLYQTLFAVQVTIGTGGSASVKIFPNVLGSQGFTICGDAISGPWGV